MLELWTLRLIFDRFLANEFGLAGRTPLESAQADEVVDAITDLVSARYAAMFETDEAMKSEKMRNFLEETLPKNLVSDIFSFLI